MIAEAHGIRSPRNGRSVEAPEAPALVRADRVESAVRELLAALGEDPDREGLLDTPKRAWPGCTGSCFRA